MTAVIIGILRPCAAAVDSARRYAGLSWPALLVRLRFENRHRPVLLSPGRVRRRECAAVICILAVGVLLRLIYVAENFVICPDSVVYLQMARNIEHAGLAAIRSHVQPLYPFALWACSQLAPLFDSGFAWRPVELANIGLWFGIVTYPLFLLIVWRFCRSLTSIEPALWYAFVVVVDPLFGFYFSNILRDPLYLLLFTLSLLCLVKAADRKSNLLRRGLSAVAAGFAAVLAFMTRAEGQILLFAALTFFLSRAAIGKLRARKGGAADLLVGLLVLVAFLAPYVPFVAYVGASSPSHSWERLWQRLNVHQTAALLTRQPRRAIEELNLAAGPFETLLMILNEFITQAPVVTFVVTAAVAWKVWSRLRHLGVFRVPGTNRMVLTTAAWTLLVLFGGVMIECGLMAQRFIWPLVLMLLPVAVASIVGLLGRVSHARLAALVLASFAITASAWNASRQWNSSKTGYKVAGAAIQVLGANPRLLTTSKRLAYYADARTTPVEPAVLRDQILAGRAEQYDVVALQTKDCIPAEMTAIKTALQDQGFRTSGALEFSLNSDPDSTAGKIIIFTKRWGRPSQLRPTTLSDRTPPKVFANTPPQTAPVATR